MRLSEEEKAELTKGSKPELNFENDTLTAPGRGLVVIRQGDKEVVIEFNAKPLQQQRSRKLTIVVDDFSKPQLPLSDKEQAEVVKDHGEEPVKTEEELEKEDAEPKSESEKARKERQAKPENLIRIHIDGVELESDEKQVVYEDMENVKPDGTVKSEEDKNEDNRKRGRETSNQKVRRDAESSGSGSDKASSLLSAISMFAAGEATPEEEKKERASKDGAMAAKSESMLKPFNFTCKAKVTLGAANEDEPSFEKPAVADMKVRKLLSAGGDPNMKTFVEQRNSTDKARVAPKSKSNPFKGSMANVVILDQPLSKKEIRSQLLLQEVPLGGNKTRTVEKDMGNPNRQKEMSDDGYTRDEATGRESRRQRQRQR